MSLLSDAMGAGFDTLPDALRAFHSPDGRSEWVGEVTVEPAEKPQARALARLSGFPGRPGTRPFAMVLMPGDETETWRRDFGGHVLTSRLRPGPDGTLDERLGPLGIRLRPVAIDGGLRLDVISLRVMALPAPLRPQGGGTERVDAEGRVTFDVESHAPGLGRLVRYHGHLSPA
jgi:hypothetical protein